MKKCPFCSEEIQDEAIKCKHCGSMLTPEGLLQAREKANKLQQQADQLESEIMNFVGQKAYEKAQQLIPQVLQLDPGRNNLKKIQEELPKRIIERDIDRAQKALAEKEIWVAIKIVGHVLKSDPTNEVALNLQARIQQTIKIHRKIMLRRWITVATVVGVFVFIIWAGVDNQYRLHRAKDFISAGQPYVAKNILAGCGWFCSWGKDDVVEKLSKAIEPYEAQERADRLKCPTCKGNGKCNGCNGEGGFWKEKRVRCGSCDGTGRNLRHSDRRCDRCYGSGYDYSRDYLGQCNNCKEPGKCPTCGGTGKNPAME